MNRVITEKILEGFMLYLIQEEKSKATIDKYMRDVRKFYNFQDGEQVTKTSVIAYKNLLLKQYKIASINSMLASVNSFFRWTGWLECKVKGIKVQRAVFCNTERVLSKSDYDRLLQTALSHGNVRIYLIMQTLCSTGIRISELDGITIESVKEGRGWLNCKGKVRNILIPDRLGELLLGYAKKQNIRSGIIFRTKHGKSLDRSYIWREMKKVGKLAGVSEGKVFPHNFRHLFARSFYKKEKDIVTLADILGHESIETTRIYMIESGEEHARKLNRLGLIRHGYLT